MTICRFACDVFDCLLGGGKPRANPGEVKETGFSLGLASASDSFVTSRSSSSESDEYAATSDDEGAITLVRKRSLICTNARNAVRAPDARVTF